MVEVSSFIPGRETLHCQTAEDPYRVAWEAAATLPVHEAIDEVVRRCGIPLEQANLLVFCELREAQPVEPLG